MNLSKMVSQNACRIEQFFGASLACVRASFEARITRLNRLGDVVDLGPDYALRIAALNQLTDVCVRGRTVLPAPDCSGTLVWEEFVYMYLESARRKAVARGEVYQPDLSDLHKRSMHESYVAYCGRLGVRPESGEPVEPPRPARIPNPEPDGHGHDVNIASLTDGYAEDVAELMGLGLASLDGVFSARKLALNRDGDVTDLGPDPAPGMAALQLLLKLVTRGRKALEPPPARKVRTYEDLYYANRRLWRDSPAPDADLTPKPKNQKKNQNRNKKT
jgi:hypothetical protein